MILGLFFIDSLKNPFYKRIANISIQVGGAFFFAISAGYIIEKIRDIKGFSVLWSFSQEFRQAGILAFYSNRDNEAEKNLKEAFAEHKRGEVLMAGASLRKFLVREYPFYLGIRNMLTKKDNSVRVRALFCSPDSNDELPVRAFVEEFNQDGKFGEDPYDWEKEIDFPFREFKEQFYKKYGIKAPSDEKLKIIDDLVSTRKGISTLNRASKNTKNSIKSREIKSAPYCTVIIFPDKAFYTPNLLYYQPPVNMTTLVFHKSSDTYNKLKYYFEFLWWANDPKQKLESEVV